MQLHGNQFWFRLFEAITIRDGKMLSCSIWVWNDFINNLIFLHIFHYHYKTFISLFFNTCRLSPFSLVSLTLINVDATSFRMVKCPTLSCLALACFARIFSTLKKGSGGDRKSVKIRDPAPPRPVTIPNFFIEYRLLMA